MDKSQQPTPKAEQKEGSPGFVVWVCQSVINDTSTESRAVKKKKRKKNEESGQNESL